MKLSNYIEKGIQWTYKKINSRQGKTTVNFDMSNDLYL